MTDPTARLRDLGAALYEATRADLERSHSPARKRRRLLAGLGVAAVLVPAGAVAANALLSTDDVAKSLPAGTLALVGTNPTCETVIDQIEYHCVLDKPPGPIGGAPAPTEDPQRPDIVTEDSQRPHVVKKADGIRVLKDGTRVMKLDGARVVEIGGPPSAPAQPESWLGAAEPSVDSTNHVNGGCRALDDAGMTWQCYIGEAAVEERIISRRFLGERVRGPGIG